MSLIADNRFLLFDLVNTTRLKASGGKESSLIKYKDLPSSKLDQKDVEVSPEAKKKFLSGLNKHFSNYKNK